MPASVAKGRYFQIYRMMFVIYKYRIVYVKSVYYGWLLIRRICMFLSLIINQDDLDTR
jgi:hypothetical protein